MIDSSGVARNNNAVDREDIILVITTSHSVMWPMTVNVNSHFNVYCRNKLRRCVKEKLKR